MIKYHSISFIGGELKDKIYADNPETIDHIKLNIQLKLLKKIRKLLTKYSKIEGPGLATTEPADVAISMKTFSIPNRKKNFVSKKAKLVGKSLFFLFSFLIFNSTYSWPTLYTFNSNEPNFHKAIKKKSNKVLKYH